MDTTTAMERALGLCRGTYQRAIVRGERRLSGADLAGKAARYGAHYARSRRAILARLEAAGVPHRIVRGRHGLLTLEIGEVCR